MVGKKFCAALCTSLAMFSLAPKAEAVSGIAVFNYISGGIQSLIGAAEITAGVLGVTGKAADILNTEEEDRKTANTVFAVVGFVLGIPGLISGVNEILNGVTAGSNKKNAQDVKALKSDMKVVKEKLGITDNSEVKK